MPHKQNGISVYTQQTYINSSIIVRIRFSSLEYFAEKENTVCCLVFFVQLWLCHFKCV